MNVTSAQNALYANLITSYKRGYTNQFCFVDLYNLFLCLLFTIQLALIKFDLNLYCNKYGLNLYLLRSDRIGVEVRKFRIISMFLIDFILFLSYNEE